MSATPKPADRTGAVLRIVLYLLIVGMPAAVAAALPDGLAGPPLRKIGLVAALTGYAMLALQVVMAARIPWLSRPFGLDRVFMFHKLAGPLAGLLVLSHPLLLAGAFARQVSADAAVRWLFNFNAPWYILLGKGVLGVGVVHVAIAWLRSALKFGQFLWAHNVLALAIVVGGFVHSTWAGDDLAQPVMRVLWSALFAAALLAWLYSKLYSFTLGRRRWTVGTVTQETHDTWTVQLAPPDGRSAPRYLPGQFHFLKLHRGPDLPAEEHPWTISSSPTQPGVLASTIKQSGDFTRTIDQTQPGHTANVRGPYGRFSYLLHPDERQLVFLVGGVGITPFLSMLRHMRDTQAERRVVLIWGNKTAEDIIARQELDSLAAKAGPPELTVVHTLDEPPDGWDGEVGHVDEAMIRRHVEGDLAAWGWWVCGPIPMAEMLLKLLAELGVPRRRIHSERFRL